MSFSRTHVGALLVALAFAVVGAQATGIVRGKLNTNHNLPMDGTLPTATHVYKGFKWTPVNYTTDAATTTISRVSSPSTAGAKTSTSNVPKVTNLPSSCLAQNECCNIPNGLRKVQNADIDKQPFASVVLIGLQLFQNNGEEITAFCSGTLALQSNTVLTAGHCVTEIEGTDLYTQLVSAVVYFGVKSGKYDKAVTVVNYATFADWANENIEIADHSLLELETAQTGHVYQTLDITKLFSPTSGYHEPFSSIGFPGGGGYGNPTTMFLTYPEKTGQCMGTYQSGSAISGTYALPLAIHSGMSGAVHPMRCLCLHRADLVCLFSP